MAERVEESAILQAILNSGDGVSKVDKDEIRNIFNEIGNLNIFVTDKNKLFDESQKKIQNDILSFQISLERSLVKESEMQLVLKQEEVNRDVISNTTDAAHQILVKTKFNLNEVSDEYDKVNQDYKNMLEDNISLVHPILTRLRNELQETKTELSLQDQLFEKEEQNKTIITTRIQGCNVQLKTETAWHDEFFAVSEKVSKEPERISRQIGNISKAAQSLSAELEAMTEKITSNRIEIEEIRSQKKEASELLSSLQRKLELHYETVEKRQRELDAVKSRLNTEKIRNRRLDTERVELDIRCRDTNNVIRHYTDNLTLMHRECEVSKRQLRIQQLSTSSILELVPKLQEQCVDGQIALASLNNQQERLTRESDELKRQLDIKLAWLSQDERIEVKKRDELDTLVNDVETMELDVADLMAEDRKLSKLAIVLSAQRDIRARESQRVCKSEKETRQQVKMKELSILELTKRSNEVNNRLEEFASLHDIVRNERNKYLSAIQSGQQVLAEMKEKIAILQSEIEILKGESSEKDGLLHREQTTKSSSQIERDAIQTEINRAYSDYRKQQEVVEQNIQEIEKLSSLIDIMEKDMLSTKRKYERLVEQRNAVGIQLVDRNDECCILHEKLNAQEEIISKGNVEMRVRDEEVHTLHIGLKENERKELILRRNLTQVDELRSKVVKLGLQLASDKETVKKLSSEMVNTESERRWRDLGGEDPDEEQLQAKIAIIEEKLNDKRQVILEKEIILEEISTLTEKLKYQASSKRDAMLKSALSLNLAQSKIRDITRRLMATVSELSMYQATALRLQLEKTKEETDYSEAENRLRNGYAPDRAAIVEWNRQETKLQLHEEAKKGNVSDAADFVSSTAVPRPNAYIADEIGLPKPYGHFAPFKPTMPGSTMRHIRAPAVSEIIL